MNKIKINTRIFRIISTFLLLIFTLILLAFNLYVTRYIKSNALYQLSTAISTSRDIPFDKNSDNKFYDIPKYQEIKKQPKNKIGEKTDIFIIDNDFVVQSRHDDSANKADSEVIGNYLVSNKADLNLVKNLLVKTSTNDYYISAKKINETENVYMIFYIEVTAMNHFAKTMNFVLLIIMLLAMIMAFIVAVFISKSISDPIKKISNFALKIGKGNFEQEKFDFVDYELNELSNSMNKSAKRLQEYDNEQKTFFQNVSHELRTPLMSIRCYAEGMQQGIMDNVKSGKIIISQTDRLTEMVEDLLYISRIDNITQFMIKEENDLRETLADCAEIQLSVAKKQNIKFVYDFSEEPVLFDYNEKYMARAFSNLISNALRYAKSEIVLTCKKEDNFISVMVSDNGVGILESDVPHIFERFYKGKDGKHGIGLSIVKSVVNVHGGDVNVYCNNGTTFKIEF